MSRAKGSAASGACARTQFETVGSTALAELGARFARFRVEHRRGVRYPAELREAALQLLREVAPDDLYRTCGLSFRQVMSWKSAKAAQSPAASIAAEPAKVRVFSVLDEEQAPLEQEPAVRGAESEFELRIGPWSVTVRVHLAGGDRARRGRA